LLKLNYIHVSAGDQDVPIRNLTINHEQVDELHPTFDKEFKLNTSRLVRTRRASFHYVDDRVDIVEDKQRPDRTPGPPIKRSVSTSDLRPKLVDSPQPPPSVKRSFLSRLKYLILGTNKNDDPQVSKPSPSDSSSYNPSRSNSSSSKPRRSASSRDDQAKSDSSSYNPSRSDFPPPKPSKSSSGPKAVVAYSRPLISSTLPPCQYSIYCRIQNSKDHTDNYSHPCRFNELCRNQASEPHLVHKRHDIPMCLEDRGCSERSNPVHRAEYRHSGLPDYLIPCRFQEACYDKSPDHRMKFFHGEEIPSIKSEFLLLL
jgi:hypothetical protein